VAAPAEPFSILCLSSQEWETALPTNRQQIMSRAAQRGHSVVFVETGGWVVRHLWRLLRGPRRASLARRLTVGEPVADRVRVVKLLAPVPFAQRYGWANAANWRIGALALRRVARRIPAPRVAWIYDPRAAAGAGTLADSLVVYDCVDDYAEQAGPNSRSRALVAAADERAGATARVVFATTRPLYERHRRRNANTHLVANVGDFEHFRAAADRSTAESDLLELPRPVLGFAGSLDSLKVDFDLLHGLAAAFPGGTLLIVGPARGTAVAAVRTLANEPNVRWVGPRAYADLPRAVAAFDVALIPYAENEYTRSVFPLKLYEYLAAGKPVVATGLPEVQGLEPHVVVVRGVDDAVDATSRALATSETGRAERMAVAAANTWESRTQRLLDLVAAELERSA
jgi:glycosyltransferase involved in cell wall biosynthesis